MATHSSTAKSMLSQITGYLWIILGSFLAALAIRMFLYPHHLIDGGVVGISMILGRLTNDALMSVYIVLVNLPFLYLAYKYIRKAFVLQMLIAVLIFALFMIILEPVPPFMGDTLEIIVLGGAILGVGCGLIIRYGGCLDGSEILGIIANKRFGFTVGQVVLFFNFFVFAGYGLIFLDWHIAVQSLLTYIVAFKMIDLVIVGLEEIKSVTIISNKPSELKDAILKDLGLGVTITHGKGGYSGEEKELLTVIVERLDLADLKDLVLSVDENAFLSVTNIYEVIYGHTKASTKKIRSKKRNKKFFS